MFISHCNWIENWFLHCSTIFWNEKWNLSFRISAARTSESEESLQQKTLFFVQLLFADVINKIITFTRFLVVFAIFNWTDEVKIYLIVIFDYYLSKMECIYVFWINGGNFYWPFFYNTLNILFMFAWYMCNDCLYYMTFKYGDFFLLQIN